jgi:hypothetical protein
VSAAMRIHSIKHYRRHKTGYSWIYIWATVESSTTLIACNVAEFVLLLTDMNGRYKSAPSDQELGLIRRRGSKESGSRQRSSRRSTRRQLSPPQSTLRRKRGVRTHVSAIPLNERDENHMENYQDVILVTRDIDQRTADDNSVYSGDDASRSQTLTYPGTFTPRSPSNSLPLEQRSSPSTSPRGKSTSKFIFSKMDG